VHIGHKLGLDIEHVENLCKGVIEQARKSNATS